MSKSINCQFCMSKDTSFLTITEDVEYRSVDLKFEYRKCNNCEVIFLVNCSTLDLNKIYPNEYYSISSKSKYSGSIQVILEKIKKLLDFRLLKKCLKKMNKNNISVLDLGGGSGWMLDYIRDIDTRVKNFTVIDLNDSSRIEVEEKGYIFIKNSIEAFDFDKSYDFILMLNILEHVNHPSMLLNKIYNNLNEGGIVLIKTPNSNSLNFKLFNKIYWGGYHAPRHFVIFNKQILDKVLGNIGFDIVSFNYTQGGPQWAASILGTFSPNGFGTMYKRTIFQLLCGLFAVLDFTLFRVFKTDQMIYILRKAN